MSLNAEPSWKESFFQDNFNVDNTFTNFTQKADLETLRRDLKNYGNELQQHMTEILKNETEAIVNLAEYLTNLNSKVEHLSLPFFQLREEIMILYQLINTTENINKVMLNNIKDNNNRKNNLNLQLGVVASSIYIDNMLKSSADSFEDLITLERIIGKYSFQKNYMDELNIVSPIMQDIMVNVEQKLLEIINRKFIENINDVITVTKCLRMYENLKKQNEAEEIYRIKIVRPYFEKLLKETSLERHYQNLDSIYAEVLDFMDSTMCVLLDAVDSNLDLKSYNFILNSFWKEFDRQSREGLPLITAPGNPELFQKRFKSTWNVLLKVAQRCKNENLLRENDTFIEHLKRFNLPVYFEIRYQKIAGDLESTLNVSNNELYASSNDFGGNLKPTIALCLAISQCFHVDIYLDQLADQFVKLSMLLLSRYLNWLKTNLKDNSLAGQSKEKFIMDSLIDLSIVDKYVCPSIENIDTTVYKIISKDIAHLCINIIRANAKSIQKVKDILKNHLVSMKVEEICNHLQQVGAIPRLYRRTNRSTPKEPSIYMIEAAKPVITFSTTFQNATDIGFSGILNDIIMQVTQQYLTLVQSVLKSVCKTEESLRRLKNRNTVTAEDSTTQSDLGSDEMKIREQIKLDAEYFLKQFYPHGSTASREIMELLKKEIN